MSKKVLILSNHFITLYNFRKELIQRLLKEDIEVFISLPKGEKNKYFKEKGCHIIETDVDRRGSNPFNDFKLIKNYIRIIKDVMPDVVLTYTVKPNLYGGIASRINKVPYICNVTGLGSAYLQGGIVNSIVKFFSKMSFRKANKVLFQNKSNLELLVKLGMLNNNFELLPGSGVNLEQFDVLPFNIDDGKDVFNFIGRVLKDKGIDEYLEAALLVKKKYPEVVFNVIGMVDQPEYEEVLRNYENKGIIKYYGFQTDLKEFITNSSCTINPSYAEGMSNVLLESAACGRPVIASNVPGCREIIDDGISGYTFEVKDTSDLVSKIEDFIELNREEKIQMGLLGRKKVENEFDRQIVINKYLEFINEI